MQRQTIFFASKRIQMRTGNVMHNNDVLMQNLKESTIDKLLSVFVRFLSRMISSTEFLSRSRDWWWKIWLILCFISLFFFFHLLAHCSAFYAEKPKYLEQMLSFMLVLAQNNNNNGKHIFLSFCYYKETHRTYSKVNLNNFLLPFDGFLQIILVLLALYVDFGIDRRVTETATEKLIKNGFATNQRRSLMSDERTSLLDCNHMKQARSYTFLSCTSHSVYAQFVFCEMRTIVLDLNNKK